MNVPSPLVLTGHEAAVYALAPWRGGLLSGGGDGLVAHWRATPAGFADDGRAVARLDDRVFALLPLARGGGRAAPAERPVIAVGTLTGDVYFVDAGAADRPPRRWRFHADGAFGLLQLPRRAGEPGDLLVGGGKGRLSRWRPDGSALVAHVGLDPGVRLRSLAYLASPGLVAVGTGAGDVHLLAPDSLRPVHVVARAHELTVFSLADAGDRFYSAGRDGKVRAWSATPPFRQLAHVDAHAATVNALAYDAASGVLASAGRDREARLWRRAGGGLVLAKALTTVRDGGHAASVNACVWAGGLLATAGDDRTVRAWRIGDTPRVVTAD